MKRKNVIVILMSFAFVSMAFGVLATDTGPISLNGSGTSTVNNAGPSISAPAINDGGAWVKWLDVDHEYQFFVNVSDANTMDDISEVTLEMWVTANQATDNPAYRYKFIYTETTTGDGVFGGSWTQIMPTTGSYLNSGASLTPALITADSGSYIFAITLEKTAKASYWYFNATTIDGTGVKVSTLNTKFDVYKYLEMTYDTGGGSQNFAWTASVGDLNVADSFDVTVTSNTPYTFAAAYENRFYNTTSGTTWSNEPTLKVKASAGSTYTLTNATATYTQWASYSAIVLAQTTTHTMYLDFESVLPALVYSGVIIYIRASV